MKTEMINEMVALNDEDMSKVNGGYEQHSLLTPMNPGYNMHPGYTNPKRTQERDNARA